MSLLYILLALVLLGVLIMVHEFGHFAVARLCGIAVKEFSMGFGPKLLQWQSRKSGTLFTLRPIPMGGYCMFYGDTDDDPDGTKMKDDPRNYNNAPVWKRMLSVAAGPAMNFVLAFVVAVVFLASFAVAPDLPMVDSVEAGMPAQAAGLRAGDLFVSVNGQDVYGKTPQEFSQIIANSAAGQPVELVVRRDGSEMPLTMVPAYDEAEGRLRIGIVITQNYARLPAGSVVPEAWRYCVQASTAIANALGKLVTTGEGLQQSAGPVGTVQMVAEQTQSGGMVAYLQLIVIISINLGLMNLLPIPALDGSRLVFMAIEAVRGKPVSQKVESIIHLCGYALLILLMLLLTFQDVLRIFQG